MVSPPWFEQFKTRIARHGLPDDYVQRLMEELSDHWEDLMEESMSTIENACARLGEPQDVAGAAVLAYRQRGYLGRHPAAATVVFGISPVLMLGLSALVVVLVAIQVASWLGIAGEGAGALGATSKVILSYGLKLLAIGMPSLLLAVGYCKLASRQGLGRGWMLASCVVLAIVAAASGLQLTFAEAPGHGSVSLSFGIRSAELLMLVQFVVPLAVAWWFLSRSRPSGPLEPAD